MGKVLGGSSAVESQRRHSGMRATPAILRGLDSKVIYVI